MKNSIPNGPWQNPLIDDGLYDAKIAHVVKGVYGKAEHPYLKIVCILPTEDVYFTTNLYFKAGGTIKSDRRLWHFCECIGVKKADVLNDPGCCNGKRLCLRVKRIQKKNANYGNPTRMSSGSFRRYRPVRKHNPVPQRAALLSAYNARGDAGHLARRHRGGVKRATSLQNLISESECCSPLLAAALPSHGCGFFCVQHDGKRTNVASVWCPMPRTPMGDYGFL
jgi:hypothetical protein